MPKQADHIGVALDGKNFGVVVRRNKFTLDGKTINLTFAGKGQLS